MWGRGERVGGVCVCGGGGMTDVPEKIKAL